MQRHFDRIGPWGRRMMRLTGAVQVTVDPGTEPADRAERWELAHRLSPLLVAAFAHSRVEQGRASAHASLRGAAWLHADPTRCGIPRRFLDDPQADPVEVYLDFALAAQVIGITWESSPAFEAMAGRPFGEWLDHGGPVGHPDLADWELHLSTLFPEVRPRTYLEVRSCDAPGRAWVGVPVLVIATALRDPRVRRPMLERLRPDHEELESLRQVAVEQGMAHAALAEAIDDLFARVRARWSGPAERDLAAYHERYIAARQSPGDELAGQIPGGGSLAIDMLLDLEDERRRWAARRGPRRWRMPVRTASSRVRTPESA
jgi:glutamate--cysteine ligase